MLLEMADFSFLLKPNKVPLCVYAAFSLSIYTLLSIIPLPLGIVNNAAKNVGVQMSAFRFCS